MADFANFYKELVDQHGREASCDGDFCWQPAIVDNPREFISFFI